MRAAWKHGTATVVLVLGGVFWSGGPGATPVDAAGGRFVDADDFDPARFPKHAKVSNRWHPLRPGTQLVYRGQATQGSALAPHEVVATVTNLVKVIDGVPTVVLFDRDYSDGQLVESELAFQAQDKRGTVWSLGEYPEEYEDGKLLGAPNAWLSGVQDAEAGILMQAKPRTRTRTYSQGFAPEIDFADQGKVKRKLRRVCVPAGCFRNVTVIDESDALDPEGGHQLKYHARGVGVVMVKPLGDRDQETLVLTRIDRLSASELAKVDAEALELDKRAYEIAPEIYGATAPANVQMLLPLGR